MTAPVPPSEQSSRAENEPSRSEEVVTQPSAEAVADLRAKLGHARIDGESDTTHRARIDWLVALYAENHAEMAVEDAYMRRDDQQRRDTASEWHMLCHAAQQRAWSRYERSKAPSWESILRDPTSQLDKDGEVAQSILTFHGSRARVCMVEIKPVVATACAPFAPSPVRSIYLCMKPLPCPEHGDGSQQLPLSTYAPVADGNAHPYRCRITTPHGHSSLDDPIDCPLRDVRGVRSIVNGVDIGATISYPHDGLCPECRQPIVSVVVQSPAARTLRKWRLVERVAPAVVEGPLFTPCGHDARGCFPPA